MMIIRTTILFAAVLTTVMFGPPRAAESASSPTPELATYLATLPQGWRNRADAVIRRCETQERLSDPGAGPELLPGRWARRTTCA